MRIDIEDFRRHYASLSDEELLELDRSELVDAAQQCYDAELARRDLDPGGAQGNSVRDNSHVPARSGILPGSRFDDDDLDADWLESATAACSFASYPGDDSATKVDEARAALQAAGIPCHASVREVQPSAAPPRAYVEYELLVPAKFNLKAISILDKELFNAEMEADWENHFAALSDEDLQSVNPDGLVAGLRDRMERLTRIYREEVERRAAR